MTLTKLALAVLGTIGLTAGTVLAVSEPTAAPLPVTLTQASKAACPGSTCASKKCSTGACPFNTTTVAVSACSAGKCSGEKCSTEKCSADKCTVGKCAAPPEQSEPITAELINSSTIGGPIQPASFTEEAETCCSRQCESSFDADGICRKHFVAARKSGCTVTGKVTLTAATANCRNEQSCNVGTCSATACSKTSACNAAECESAACDSTCNSECEGKCKSACENSSAATKATRRITLGLGLSTGGPLVRISTGTNAELGTDEPNACPATSSVGRVLLSLISGQSSENNAAGCKADHAVAATACEAKPTCVSLGCPVAACATSHCDCCKSCDCDACQCEDEKCRTYAGQAVTNADQNAYHIDLFGDGHHYVIRHQSADRYFDGANSIAPPRPHRGSSALLGDYPPLKAPSFGEQPPQWHPPFRIAGVEVNGSCELPSGLPPVIIPEQEEAHRNYDSVHVHHHAEGAEVPGRVRIAHGSIPYAPRLDVRPTPQADFLPHQRIRLSGFAAPVTAPLPPRNISPRLEGTWTRSSSDGKSSFSFRNDRVSGQWHVTNSIELRFSGSCSATKDGQFIGIIDEIEAKGADADSFRVQMIGQRLVDQPFAARFVVDGDSLIIKDIRCSGLTPAVDQNDASADLLQYVRTYGCGRYERGEE